MYDSDHRGIFIDIDENILFQEHESKIVFHEYRKLKSCTPKRVNKYMKIMKHEWKLHKINEKFERLLEISGENLNSFEIELNKLDQQITEIMHHAEKSCTKMSSHHLDD